MNRAETAATSRGLSPENLRRVLEITRDLAAPFDLNTLLYAVVDAAKDLLEAEGSTVWQYLAASHELEMQVARGLDAIRISADHGIVGECVRTRQVINVPDCYADPRFNRAIDKATGKRTRCLLTLPLIGDDDDLVGVLQVVNRREGVFDADDEALATALAAQCAVAMQRVRMTERLLSAEKLRQEIAVAREVQVGTLPTVPPNVAGYDLAGLFRPADDTGGDTYDFVPTRAGGLWLLMGDATGHGIGPALSATQVRAMLRVAQRLGASLDDTFRHINDQLVVDLPEDRFVTAFLGELDPEQHTIRYHSGGQGPLLHFHAEDVACDFHPPTTFPLGAMPLARTPEARRLSLAPGDVFALVSDGVYEYQDAANRQFGEQGVAEVLARYHDRPMHYLLGRLMDALEAFGQGAPQLDDITVVLLRRLPGNDRDAIAGHHAGPAARADRAEFERSFDALAAVFDFLSRAPAMAGADAATRYSMDFAVEELFTNMVKYNPAGRGPIALELERAGEVVTCRLVDPDSDRFDVTAAPDVDVERPVAERQPGGLGLHLIRRMVDAVDYDYADRVTRISLRKTIGGH